MSKASTKALYLFLCSILGMVLFAMLHRAIFVLYDLLVFMDSTFTFGMSAGAIQALDFFALLVALFLGGWYGIVLGLEWYSMVYGPNAEVKAGMFHTFIPHQWRGQNEINPAGSKPINKPINKFVADPVSTISKTPAATSTTVKVTEKPPVKQVTKEVLKETIKEQVKEFVKPTRQWTFDDLVPPTPPTPTKPVAKKKTTAKKTVAKKVVKKPKAE